MSFDVVTGGAGFIGSHLVDKLIASGSRVRVIDNLAVGRLENLRQHRSRDEFEFVAADVADKPMMLKLLAGADRVFHLAALADIVPSIQNSEAYFRANVDGTYAVAEAARATKVRRFVYTASSSCYGIPNVYPTPESAPTDPRYPYALTKYLGEQIVMHWAQLYKLPAISVRFFNVFGPRARTSGTYGAVFGVFLAQLLAGKPLTIVGDGEQTRDFTFVADAVDAMIVAADSDHSGDFYNVGSNEAQSINRLVKLLMAKETVHIPKRPGEPDCTLADTRKIREHLGWRPKVPFERGVQTMLDNIEYWRNAPIWTPDKIQEATADWFKYLGEHPKAGAHA